LQHARNLLLYIVIGRFHIGKKMENLDFKFVLMTDGGELLKNKQGETIAFDNGNKAMEYNYKNEYKYNVMQIIPKMEYKWVDGKLIRRT